MDQDDVARGDAGNFLAGTVAAPYGPKFSRRSQRCFRFVTDSCEGGDAVATVATASEG